MVDDSVLDNVIKTTLCHIQCVSGIIAAV